ncbi:insulinase family protein [Sphingobium sufflavum]|uniref:M16 family metallopeptidase n=1 Tax=Sphingobium sufflavum TaxID=1129547 RepID=UPI001F22FCE9|nr:insulinase family protein [Sphingobium sufflavum]MCE7796298.1 insulinase family protein [Sphingobium sufflavum]
MSLSRLASTRRTAASLLIIALLTAQPLGAQPKGAASPSVASPATAPVAAPPAAPRPWLYENSDVPIDPAWRFGTLSNGLRYAIRNNGVPPGQVSIRVRVDVGSLMERPDERGFAHFIEHLTFRGSRDVPDGEAKRVWQRLGATFGSDSNAQTTPTGTTYALDLPEANAAGLDESMKILSGMLAAPNIVPQAVDAERAVVTAEMRESLGPAVTVGNAAREFYFAGQPLARSNPIGTTEALTKARAESLKAFHDRWYRPDRTVIAISGDIDPALMETYVQRYFNGWKVAGARTPDPDFGKPDPAAPETRVIVERSSPPSIGLAWLRPWRPKADTIAYNQGKLIETLALQIINRRLEEAARGGASYITASVDQNDVSRSIDGTFVTITPVGGDWKKAMDDVRAIIADATRTPPSEEDVARDYAQLETAFAIGAENADTEASAQQAETLTGAVDIRETTVTAQAALDIYRSAKPLMTPERMLAATRRMFTGTAKRALLTLPVAEPGANVALATAFKAAVQPAKDVRLAGGTVSMDALPKLPPAGTVVSREPAGTLKIEKVTYSNGVKLLLFANGAEKEKVRINVRWGNGEQSFAPGQDTAIWAAPYVLATNGIGDLGQRQLDQLTNGRRMEFKFSVAENAFELAAVSRPADYKDQLRLYAAKLAYPRWDAGPLARVKGVFGAAERASSSSPDALLGRDLTWLLRNKDNRFAPATADRVAKLTPEAFRAIWEPRLQQGPIEVEVFGDVKPDEAIAAVAETFGALPRRTEVPPPEANRKLVFPAHVAKPLVLRHDGSPEQAAAVIAWPTGGGYVALKDSRQLEILSQIINDRLFERFRSMDGAAYSPNVSNVWPLTYDSGGYVAVSSQIKPDRIGAFGTIVHDIARDLATTPVSDDELQRIIAPMRQLLGRASTGNAFWMAQIEGATRDPQVLPALESFGTDLLDVTAADIQRLAKQYLVEDRSWSVIVLSKATPLPAALANGWPDVKLPGVVRTEASRNGASRNGAGRSGAASR